MKTKRLLLCLLLVCLLLQPLRIGADQPEAGLLLTYSKDGQAFEALQIRIYRVAELFEDGTYGLTGVFAGYPVNIYGITNQNQWQAVADTLSGYIAADSIPADREMTTDEAGAAHFENLLTGLYFVEQVVAEREDGRYLFNRFMVYVPTPQSDGTYVYQVEAKPKCVAFTPKTHYTVTKLWQDEGSPIARPQAVTVAIYHRGQLQHTQILSAQNNWSYTWTVEGEDDGQWSVAERSVPSHYEVSVSQNGNVFSIVNTAESVRPTPPTGDSFAPLPWILALSISGLALLVLVLYGRRRK